MEFIQLLPRRARADSPIDNAKRRKVSPNLFGSTGAMQLTDVKLAQVDDIDPLTKQPVKRSVVVGTGANGAVFKLDPARLQASMLSLQDQLKQDNSDRDNRRGDVGVANLEKSRADMVDERREYHSDMIAQRREAASDRAAARSEAAADRRMRQGALDEGKSARAARDLDMIETARANRVYRLVGINPEKADPNDPATAGKAKVAQGAVAVLQENPDMKEAVAVSIASMPQDQFSKALKFDDGGAYIMRGTAKIRLPATVSPPSTDANAPTKGKPERQASKPNSGGIGLGTMLGNTYGLDIPASDRMAAPEDRPL